MSTSDQYYDPAKISARLKDMMMKGNTAELPGLIQELLTQSVANPLTQAILAPLAQSLAVPLSQYFSNPTYSNPRRETIIREDDGHEASNRLDPQLFEIHGFVIVRVAVPEDIDEKDIKLSIAASHITIKGDPSGNDHIIPLPPGTKKEGAVAAFKDRILEIKIPREVEEEASNEITVDYL